MSYKVVSRTADGSLISAMAEKLPYSYVKTYPLGDWVESKKAKIFYFGDLEDAINFAEALHITRSYNKDSFCVYECETGLSESLKIVSTLNDLCTDLDLLFDNFWNSYRIHEYRYITGCAYLHDDFKNAPSETYVTEKIKLLKLIKEFNILGGL